MIDDNIRPLISPEEVRKLARPTDADSDTVDRAIEEASQIVKETIGGELFYRLSTGVKYGLLMEGGTYETRCGRIRMFAGLKKALAYFTYARIIKTGNVRSSRFGLVSKNGDYSSHAGQEEIAQAYRDAYSFGQRYLQECLVYIMGNPGIFPDYRNHGQLGPDTMEVRVIGD